MGGCRCSFRNCENSTISQPGMHFFHFPFRDMERCEKWALYSNNIDFLLLPPNKLRNKVACETHFRDHCFMNYKKERLIKTAVPTLLKLSTGEIIDYESEEKNEGFSLLQIDKLEKSKSTTPILLNNILNKDKFNLEKKDKTEEFDFQIEHIDKLMPMEQIEYLEEVTPPPLIPKLRNTVLEEPKVLNGLTASSTRKYINIDMKSTKAIKRVNQMRKITLPDSTPAKIQKIDMNIINESNVSDQQKDLSANQNIVNDPEETDDVIVFESITPPETIELTQMEEPEHPPQPEITAKPTIDKDLYLKTMADQSQQINELKAMLAEQMENMENLKNIKSVLRPEIKMEKGAKLNKSQLFNGIRKYLNPSMVALLRMEMFGGPEREYKPDEKNFAIDMLKFGCNMYEYMRDEWRFHLPPKKDVEQWMREREEDGSEVEWDDC